MDAFLQMRLHESDLTPAERKVYDAIQKNPEAVLQCTTTMAAKKFNVSQSAVSRFCQKIGFDSFGDFQMSLMVSLSTHTPGETDTETKLPTDYLCDMLRATDSALGEGDFETLCDRLLGARRILVTGGGLSSPPAHMLSMELLKYNIPCFFVETGQEMIHLHVTGPEDVIVIFSSKNDTQRLMLNVVKEMPKAHRPFIIMVTHSADHPLRKLVDQLIVLPTWQTERYPVYIEPMTSMVAFCSLLMVHISKRMGTTPEALPPIVNGKVRG